MNAKVSFILGLLVGAGAGAGALYYQKKKFEKQLAEELSTQREHLAKEGYLGTPLTSAMEDPSTKPEPVEDNTTESSDDEKEED